MARFVLGRLSGLDSDRGDFPSRREASSLGELQILRHGPGAAQIAINEMPVGLIIAASVSPHRLLEPVAGNTAPTPANAVAKSRKFGVRSDSLSASGSGSGRAKGLHVRRPEVDNGLVLQTRRAWLAASDRSF